MSDKILVFIPMYNCQKQITRVLGQLNQEILNYVSEIIVINNRSTDDSENITIEYCKQNPQLPVKILRNKENYGLGGSHKVAFNYAIKNKFDYMITLHGDDQGQIVDFLPILKNLEYRKYDCCLGSRFMKGSKLEGYSKFRTFGNIVYNLLFSIGTGQKIYDLGSGLNMYKVDILRDQYYSKFKDNLMFNYYEILSHAYSDHKILFFPIVWKEEDQVSNVKMMNQATRTLLMLFSYVINKKGFLAKEHRDKVISDYASEVIYSNIVR